MWHGEIFGSALLQPVRSVCISSERFFARIGHGTFQIVESPMGGKKPPNIFVCTVFCELPVGHKHTRFVSGRKLPFVTRNLGYATGCTACLLGAPAYDSFCQLN